MKIFDKTYNKIMKSLTNSNLFNSLKFLSTFKYGCLFNDGKLITDLNEIEQRDGTNIIVQSPETFLKNKIGMCHDATIYIDKLCNDCNLFHKCIFLFSNLSPRFTTHSFVVVEIENKWKIIDVFSKKDCIYEESFESYEDAIYYRINEWIINDNASSSDLDVFIENEIKNEKQQSLPDFLKKIENSFSVYYTKDEMKNIYIYDEKILKEETIQNEGGYHFEPLNNQYEIINETTYFDDIHSELETYFINELNDMFKEKESSRFLEMKQIVNFLLNDKIKNYKNFHNFLEILKNSVGQLKLKIGINDNFYEFPETFTNHKIRIYENESDIDNKLNDLQEDYEEYLKERLKQTKFMNDQYKIILDTAKYQPSWGILLVNINYLKK